MSGGWSVSRILEGALRLEVERLCREAEAHAREGERAEALARLLEAWELLPEPREAYAAAADIYRGLSGVLRDQGLLSGGLDLLVPGRGPLGPGPATAGWRPGAD